MIIELKDGEEWEYSPPGSHSNIVFASASSPEQPVFSVYLNNKLADRVYLTAPHSWWAATNQSICGTQMLEATDTLRFKVKGGKVAVRLDLEEF